MFDTIKHLAFYKKIVYGILFCLFIFLTNDSEVFAAELVKPPPDSTLSSSTVIFKWNWENPNGGIWDQGDYLWFFIVGDDNIICLDSLKYYGYYCAIPNPKYHCLDSKFDTEILNCNRKASSQLNSSTLLVIH